MAKINSSETYPFSWRQRRENKDSLATSIHKQAGRAKYHKQHLAVIFQVFAKQGFDEGFAGTFPFRIPPILLPCLENDLMFPSQTNFSF
jgi:hypothetical protein